MTQAQDNPKTDNVNKGSSTDLGLTPRSGILGLQGGILFAIGFAVVGYSIPLSICLGAIAGVAIGALINWWQLDDETPEALQVNFSDEEIYGLRRKSRRLRQKQYLEARNSYRTRRQRSSITGLFFETGLATLTPPERPGPKPRADDEKKEDNQDNE